MKKIIYNEQNIKEKDINNYIKRAKIILINSNNEILLANSSNNYYLIGGHVEENESDLQTLKRETFEETGIELKLNNIKPFFSIIYKTKDYPKEKINTKYISNYYYLKIDDKINHNNIHLTQEEIESNFKLKYIHIDNIVNVLKENIKVATKPNVVRDTLLVIEEFIKIYK